jgi:Leucine-rich repeat (LRR) protein
VSVPEGIPSNTTHLDLRGNKIVNLLDGEFGNLQNLVFLDLSGNRIQTISAKAFDSLTSLETL